MTALHRTHGGTLSYRELGAQYGLSADAVRSRIRYHVGKLALNGANGGKSAQVQEFGHVGEAVNLTVPAYKAPIPATAPLYRPYPAGDDTPLWDEWKQKRVNQMAVTVLCLFDFHIPDHSEDALRLLYNLAFVVQPEVIVFGGDMFDFDLLSSFDTPVNRERGDAYQEIRGPWTEIIDHLRMQCRTAKFVAFGGNHERRRMKFWASVGRLGAPFYVSNELQFVEIVRSRERVWWLAEVEETSIGELIIQHGERYGENAAKSTLKQLGWGVSIVQGHSHRPSHYVQRVNRATGRVAQVAIL